MGRKSPLNQNLVKTPNGGLNDWGTQSDSVSEVTLCHAKPALIGRIYGAVQSIARSVREVGEIFVAKEVNRKARYAELGCLLIHLSIFKVCQACSVNSSQFSTWDTFLDSTLVFKLWFRLSPWPWNLIHLVARSPTRHLSVQSIRAGQISHCSSLGGPLGKDDWNGDFDTARYLVHRRLCAILAQGQSGFDKNILLWNLWPYKLQLKVANLKHISSRNHRANQFVLNEDGIPFHIKVRTQIFSPL